MLFGSTDTFAVEAEFLEIHGKWIYGRLRFWFEGIPLGDFEDTSDLASSARWGRVFLSASPRRTRPDLDSMPAEQVFDVLYGRFVVPVHSEPHARTSGHAERDLVWDRDPYLLDDVGESALRDKVAVVVVRKADGSDRILANDYQEGRLHGFHLAQGVCDHVINSYCTWVESLRTNTPS
jgi:hypothetical protein